MDDIALIENLVAKARAAQKDFEAHANQEILDRASESHCLGLTWNLAAMKNWRSLQLRPRDLVMLKTKSRKIIAKTLGLLRDLKDVKTFGLVEENQEKGLSTYLRPKGVGPRLCPRPTPLATPINNAVNAIKTGNAIILAPSPKGAEPPAVTPYRHMFMRSWQTWPFT